MVHDRQVKSSGADMVGEEKSKQVTNTKSGTGLMYTCALYNLGKYNRCVVHPPLLRLDREQR
jgi:hypothetical protein